MCRAHKWRPSRWAKISLAPASLLIASREVESDLGDFLCVAKNLQTEQFPLYVLQCVVAADHRSTCFAEIEIESDQKVVAVVAIG